MRLLAGNAYGLQNDVNIHSPLFYLHVVLSEGAKLDLPKEHSERGVYIAKRRPVEVREAGILRDRCSSLIPA